MSDGEKIPLIEHHSVNTVKCISLKEQKNMKLYVSKLTLCNKVIFINILCILITQLAVGCLSIKDIIVKKLDIAILIAATILITHILFGCLTIVKVYLIDKISMNSEKFKPYIYITFAIFVTLFVIIFILFVSYLITMLTAKIYILLVLSSIILIFEGIIIIIETIYINL